MWVLNLRHMMWTQIKCQGTHKLWARFGHSSAILGTELILFGGIGSDYHFQANFEVVELDWEKNISKVKLHKDSNLRILDDQLVEY